MEIPTNMNCQGAAYSDGLVYGFGNSLVYFYVLEKQNLPNIDLKALGSKKNVTDVLADLSFMSKEQLLNVK